ncbi:phospholipase-like protein [Tanacetum coccineum]
MSDFYDSKSVDTVFGMWLDIQSHENDSHMMHYVSQHQLLNPNVALISSLKEMRQAWFMASVYFIKGLADQDDKFLQDDEARVNCIEHNNGMCGDTEIGKFVQDEEARVNGIEHHNGMCSDTEVGKFMQDEEAKVIGIEHHNRMCGDTDDGNFVEGIDETICPKSNQMSVKEGMPSSSSSHIGNDKDASHLDDLMEIDGENVDNYEDDYMLMLNDEEKPVKSSLNDMELEQEPDKIAVKQGILEQQPNAPKGKTTVFEETVRVKFKEKLGLGRGLGPLKVKKKKNYQRALRPNYVLRSAQDRKKKLAMALKPPFGQKSASTPVPKKKKIQDYENRSYCAAFRFRDFSGQPRIRSINHIMTHEPFVENLSRPDDCKSDKVTVPEHMCEFITIKALPEYRFPWGKRDIVIGRSFWLSLSCLNTGNSGWLNDHVYFLVNEPKTHWCLAELEIRTGVVTFYDSLGWASGSRRCWWRRIKKLFPEKLTVYLVMHGIYETNGISVDDYKITYKYADAPFQASLFGDCGIWVYIFIYRLCCNLPLTVDDPLETVLAYRERMLEYFWTHKILFERTSSVV